MLTKAQAEFELTDAKDRPQLHKKASYCGWLFVQHHCNKAGATSLTIAAVLGLTSRITSSTAADILNHTDILEENAQTLNDDFQNSLDSDWLFLWKQFDRLGRDGKNNLSSTVELRAHCCIEYAATLKSGHNKLRDYLASRQIADAPVISGDITGSDHNRGGQCGSSDSMVTDQTSLSSSDHISTAAEESTTGPLFWDDTRDTRIVHRSAGKKRAADDAASRDLPPKKTKTDSTQPTGDPKYKPKYIFVGPLFQEPVGEEHPAHCCLLKSSPDFIDKFFCQAVAKDIVDGNLVIQGFFHILNDATSFFEIVIFKTHKPAAWKLSKHDLRGALLTLVENEDESTSIVDQQSNISVVLQGGLQAMDVASKLFLGQKYKPIEKPT